MSRKNGSPQSYNPKEEESEASSDRKGISSEELMDSLQRVQADFENFRKRTLKELEMYEKKGEIHAFRELLPFIDAFEKSLNHLEGEQQKGMKQLHDQLLQIMERNKIKPMKSTVETFNRHYHECLRKGCNK
jgi:molecular chaperone GrpE